MFSKFLWPVIVYISITFPACAPEPSPTVFESEKLPAKIEAPAAAKTWETQWEHVKNEARKEGRLVILTTIGPELRQAFSEAMKEYGITLEAVIGRGVELRERIFRETRAGIYDVDLFLSGIVATADVMESSGQPLRPLLILPEVKEPTVWYRGELNFMDKEERVLAFIAYLDQGIHVNTEIVRPGEISSMQDLLAPKWKGKIILNDPTITGRGEGFLRATAVKLGEDYIKKLAGQEPLLTRDMRQLADWVARGRYPIGLGLLPDNYQEYKRAGAPVSNLVLPEVSYLLSGAGNIGYMEKASHPNAAKVFVNWLLSRNGQKIWQDIRMDQSARTDLLADHLEKSGLPVRKGGVDYLDTRTVAWRLEEKSTAIIMSAFSTLRR